MLRYGREHRGLNWAHRPGIVTAHCNLCGPDVTGHAHHPIFGQSQIRSRDQAGRGRRIRNGSRSSLQLDDQGNLINERIAKRIIELAKAGELDPNLLCECVLREFRQHSGDCARGCPGDRPHAPGNRCSSLVLA
jgi:hypothetical protein